MLGGLIFDMIENIPFLFLSFGAHSLSISYLPGPNPTLSFPSVLNLSLLFLASLCSEITRFIFFFCSNSSYYNDLGL